MGRLDRVTAGAQGVTRVPPDPPASGGGAARGWVVCGASVRGAQHGRHDAPNQDAFHCVHRPEAPVAVVADGHGAEQYVRSAHGARLAADLLADQLAHLDPGADPDTVTALLTAAAACFIDRWRTAVLEAAEAEPFSAFELEQLHEPATTASNPLPRELQIRAYGTTVLGVLVAGGWVHAVAIGDGEIGCVAADGTHRSLCPSPAVIGVDTDSLASPDPTATVRVDVCPSAGVIAVWACTDGFSTAQADEGWQALVGRQLAEQLAGRPPARIVADLEGWLRPAAAVGDDTTMVLVLLDLPEQAGEGSPRAAFWRRL